MAALTVTDQSTQADIVDSSVTTVGNRLLGLYDRGGHIKAVRFTYINDTGSALAANSIVRLCTIGPGIVLPTSIISVSAQGGGRTLDVGTQEYTDNNGDTVSSEIDAFLDGLDVSSAVTQKTFGSDTNSNTTGDGAIITGQTDVLAKIIGDTLLANATIEGFIFIVSQ